jgi:hypothetical protein
MFGWFKYHRVARQFQTADVAQRVEIVQQRLSDLQPADALKILRIAIMDGSPRVRYAAALALVEFDEPQADTLLATAVPDEELDIACLATRTLLARNWQPHRSIEKRRMHIAHLIHQSEGSDSTARRRTVSELARIDDPLAPYEAPDDLVERVAQEASPQSVAFLMRAAPNHPQIALDIVRALVKILRHHAGKLSESRLRELAVLEDVNVSDGHGAKRRCNCKAIREAATRELARRAAERETRKKYFCPHCSFPIPLARPLFGSRIRCPRCRESHVCSEENYC